MAADMTGWDLDSRGIPTFVAAQRFAIATVPDAGGGILRIDYAKTQEEALAGNFESIQVYLFDDQAEALSGDLARLVAATARRRQA